MRKPLGLPSPLLIWLSLATLLLSGCGTASPATLAGTDAEWDEAIECEEPGADACVVLACDGEQGECGVFACEDVDLEAVSHVPLAHGAELAQRGAYRPPFRAPGPSRNWRRTELRDGARPRLTFHFRYRDGYLPAFPRLEGKLIKHHWTMVIPEHVHLRIHRCGGRGGAWNQAWREFRDAKRGQKVSPKELMAKAFELAYHFDIVGPLMPYGHTLVPPGPQLLAPWGQRE